MNTFIIVLLILSNFILETTLFPHFNVFRILPNMGLVIVVSVAILRDRKTGSIVGLTVGLLQDTIFSGVIGINAFIYFFLGYFAGMAGSKLSRDNVLTPFILTLGSTIAYHLFYNLFMFFLNYNIGFSTFFKEIVLMEMIYNSIIAIFICRWLSKIFIVPTVRFRRR
ncbi:MAG: rod shape-determining protein MreD [Tissierellia bacterium]|nr:rod shape-determining protein MreD [Tissierellia bacterium]